MKRLETQSAFYREQIAEAEALEKRATIATAVYSKFRAVYDDLTAEEKNAADGMYVFIHSGKVDLVKVNPSPTDMGEGEKFVKMMAKAEALALALQNQPERSV